MKCIFDLQNTKNDYNVQFLHKNTIKNGNKCFLQKKEDYSIAYFL